MTNSSLSVRRKRCKNVLIRLAVKARGSEVQKTMAKYTKRRDKRGYEWKSAYREKEALMLERGYPEVSPHDFYRDVDSGCADWAIDIFHLMVFGDIDTIFGIEF